jgi:hypothetical protein
MAGRLAPPWQPAAMEVLWEPLPHRLSRAEAEAISFYSYPPRRELVYADEPALGRLPFLERLGLEVYHDRAFRFSWQTRARPGVEVVVVWAHRFADERALTAVASACTVVTEDGTLPPALARWAALRGSTLQR